ncbi:DUF4136 domain-containing protein [Silvibacterium acidisoli]|uniref:DUF4136 domain-containing protein n=1 Tax=Acidobacteriaceae bacterium ZG23-2 TaxID=2883246 RepID=UPI00406C9A09
MKKFYPAALLFASLALSAPAFASVQTDYDHGADYTRYKTYSWGQVKVEDSAMADRIKTAIDQNMQAKGWQLVPNGGKTTIFVIGQVTSEKQLESTYWNIDTHWGNNWNWNAWGWGNTGGFVTTSRALVFDIFDSSSHALLFRGINWDEKANSGKNANQLDKDITKIFSRFPPK